MGKFKPREWTKEEIEKLKTMVKTHTWLQIGEALGVEEKTARTKAKELGFHKYILNKSESARDWMVLDYSDAHGIAPTCDRYGMTKDMVKNARKRAMEKRNAIRQSFVGEKVDLFRSACYKAAYRMGFGFDAEDFSGWAMVRVLEGRDTSIKNLAFDYRDEQGLSKLSVGKNRVRNALSIKETDDPETPGVQIGVQPVQDKTASHMFELADALGLDRIDRIVFLMYWKDGFRLKEIGKYLDVSESRVSQMIAAIEKLLIKNAHAKALLKER